MNIFAENPSYNLYSYETQKDCFWNIVKNGNCITLKKKDELMEDAFIFAQKNLELDWEEIMKIPEINKYFQNKEKTKLIYQKILNRYKKISTFWKKK